MSSAYGRSVFLRYLEEARATKINKRIERHIDRFVRWHREQVRIKNEVWITPDQAIAIADRHLIKNGFHKISELSVDRNSGGYIVYHGSRGYMTFGISPTGKIVSVTSSTR